MEKFCFALVSTRIVSFVLCLQHGFVCSLPSTWFCLFPNCNMVSFVPYLQHGFVCSLNVHPLKNKYSRTLTSLLVPRSLRIFFSLFFRIYQIFWRFINFSRFTNFLTILKVALKYIMARDMTDKCSRDAWDFFENCLSWVTYL